MTEPELDEIMAAVRALAEIFVAPLSAPAIALYVECLHGYPAAKILAALRIEMRTRKREQGFPTPGDIAEVIDAQPEEYYRGEGWGRGVRQLERGQDAAEARTALSRIAGESRTGTESAPSEMDEAAWEARKRELVQQSETLVRKDTAP